MRCPHCGGPHAGWARICPVLKDMRTKNPPDERQKDAITNTTEPAAKNVSAQTRPPPTWDASTQTKTKDKTKTTDNSMQTDNQDDARHYPRWSPVKTRSQRQADQDDWWSAGRPPVRQPPPPARRRRAWGDFDQPTITVHQETQDGPDQPTKTINANIA